MASLRVEIPVLVQVEVLVELNHPENIDGMDEAILRIKAHARKAAISALRETYIPSVQVTMLNGWHERLQDYFDNRGVFNMIRRWLGL